MKFLRYFGERGADGERLGRRIKCLQLYSIGRYISSSVRDVVASRRVNVLAEPQIVPKIQPKIQPTM